jgi:anaerobic magnesium-protoporphyrin IX monomethyl ester cyclase
MTDVLLGHSLFMALDPKQVAKQKPYPPLGTLYAASQLRDAGFSVALFDAMLAPGPQALDDALERHSPRLVAFVEDSFNFLSKMCLGLMRDAGLEMVGASASRAPVLVAGSDPSDEPGPYLDAGAAAVILGEPDHAIVEVARALLVTPGARDVGPPGPGALAAVSGLALSSGSGQPALTAPRLPERTPDRFAWPARDLVDMDAYRSVWEAAHGVFSLNIVSTRGCPFHCNWCAKPIWGQRYAMRSPADVASEMAEMKRLYDPGHLWFADDIFGLRPEWTVEFGREVVAAGAEIPFQIQCRVDLITEAAADGLARAGCAEVWLGVESGSQRILDAMEKGVRVEDVAPAVSRLRRHGIRVGFFLQLGYPGEEWSDILATRRLVTELAPDEIGVSVSYPLPGTRFHRSVAAQMDGKRHWAHSSDLSMMFRGTYDTAFYRRLHGLLHAELDALAGTGDAALVDAEWSAMEREQEAWRVATPTRLPTPEVRSVPDLSGSHN